MDIVKLLMDLYGNTKKIIINLNFLILSDIYISFGLKTNI